MTVTVHLASYLRAFAGNAARLWWKWWCYPLRWFLCFLRSR